MRVVGWILLAAAALVAIWLLFFRKKPAPSTCEKVVSAAEGFDKSGKIATVGRDNICEAFDAFVDVTSSGAKYAASGVQSVGQAVGLLGDGGKPLSQMTCAELAKVIARPASGAGVLARQQTAVATEAKREQARRCR